MTPMRRYAWQPSEVGLDVVLQMSEVANATDSFHLHDANKNIVQVVDETGIVVAGYAYSPFGNAIGKLPSDFGFSSEYYDSNPKLIPYNYRYFMPIYGQWLSRDLIQVNNSYNLYRFLNNNPCTSSDYLGLVDIKYRYISGNSAKNIYIANFGDKDMFIIAAIALRPAIEVWPEPSTCCCKDNTKGNVILSQKIKYRRFYFCGEYWDFDDNAKIREEEDNNGNIIIRIPAYTDPSPKCPRGGTPSNKPGGYIDSPTLDMDLLVHAWCRCSLGDEGPLAVKKIPYTIYGSYDGNDGY